MSEQQRSLEEITADIKELMGVTDDDPERQRHLNICNATHHGSHCAVCARELKPDEPVWREPIQTGCNFYGWAKYWLAPRCRQCAEGPEGYYEARPCMGCGRTVNTPWHRAHSKITACCEDCRDKAALAAARAVRRKARGHPICPECQETFEPTRSDSKFCSGACRQKAYRKRVADSECRSRRLRKSRNAAKVVRP